MIDARKPIIFRDEHYNEKFRIKDGDSIKITMAYDGEELVRKCRFLDATHMEVGSSNNTYHMDEFMEKQAQVGNTYEPVPNPAPTMDILLVKPGQEPRDIEIPISISALRELVGGPLAMIPVGTSSAIVYANPGDGTFDKTRPFGVCGLNEGNLASLHPYEARRFTRDLRDYALDAQKIPSLFARMEEANAKAIDPLPGESLSLQAQLAVAKKEAAAQNGDKNPAQAANRKKDGAAL